MDTLSEYLQLGTDAYNATIAADAAKDTAAASAANANASVASSKTLKIVAIGAGVVALILGLVFALKK